MEVRITQPGYLDYDYWRLEYIDDNDEITLADHFTSEVFQSRLPTPKGQQHVIIKRTRFDFQDVESKPLFDKIEDITNYDPKKSASLVENLRVPILVLTIGKEEAIDRDCALMRVTEAGDLEKIDLD